MFWLSKVACSPITLLSAAASPLILRSALIDRGSLLDSSSTLNCATCGARSLDGSIKYPLQVPNMLRIVVEHFLELCRNRWSIRAMAVTLGHCLLDREYPRTPRVLQYHLRQGAGRGDGGSFGGRSVSRINGVWSIQAWRGSTLCFCPKEARPCSVERSR